ADATNGTVRKKVEETAEDIGGNGTNWVHGRVNAHDAVKPPVP
ncbi:MAG: hypothetical protein JWR71_1693, partial [Pseudarthrobacter sp.]|nr:hypothetical protein [Pseudarthrobacter sp.]